MSGLIFKPNYFGTRDRLAARKVIRNRVPEVGTLVYLSLTGALSPGQLEKQFRELHRQELKQLSAEEIRFAELEDHRTELEQNAYVENWEHA